MKEKMSILCFWIQAYKYTCKINCIVLLSTSLLLYWLRAESAVTLHGFFF